MAARIYIAVVALCWTALLCGFALAEAGSQPQSFRSLWWVPAFSAPLWVSFWVAGRTSLVARSVRWVSVFSLGGLLYLLFPMFGPWTLQFWMIRLPQLVLLSVILLLVVPEVRQLTSWGAAKRTAMGLAVAGVLVAVGLGVYSLYQSRADAENSRLAAIAASELEKIDLPPGNVFIYEEVKANRTCKTAGIGRVFATEIKPGELCRLISATLHTKGWQVLDGGCKSVTYPHPPRPVHETRPSFDYARLVARVPSRSLVQLIAEPQGSWGLQSILSTHGDSAAISLARKGGSAFFTIALAHWDDRALVDRMCPDDGGRCECHESTLFAWKFADGRRLRRSD
jgi:hypothetical protein